MHVTAKASRFRLVLAVLLIVLGLCPAVAPGTTGADPGQYRAPVAGELASTVPSMHDDLNDWLRLSGAARHTLSTALPDSWWAVYTCAVGECAPRGWSTRGAISSVEAAAATPASRSSRAPPAA